jgi:hypothetical protein
VYPSPKKGLVEWLQLKALEFKSQYLKKKKLKLVLASWDTEIRRIKVGGQSGQIVLDPHLQNNQSKMDWRCGSSGRTPALQAQGSKFKPHCHQKRN